jgi:GntR family transcriptional regulator/MocR family aminotransferase
VIFMGTFNKLLFPALRLGYVVLPPSLVDPFLACRYWTDLRCVGIDQAILCDFIVEGHFGRHLRRMRELYAGRLGSLLDAGRKYLKGLMDFSQIQAGLHITGLLRNGITSRAAEMAGLAKGIDTMGLDRMTLRRTDLNGLVMGFAGFDERAIRSGIATLAGALEDFS